MDIKIVFHPSGDWKGLYINGELQCEGHSISASDIIYWIDRNCSLGIEQSSRDLGNEEGFNIEDFDFPSMYSDIELQKNY